MSTDREIEPVPHSWTIITVTYNSAAALRAHWSGIHLAADCEWIVVDNASSDDSARVAAELGARVIPLTSNIGFGGANNVGFRDSASTYVLFANPDVTVDASSLATLAEVVEATGGLVSPQLMNMDGSVQPNGRGFPFLADKIRNRARKSPNHRYLRVPGHDEDLPVIWLMGATVAGLRTSLDVLGPWDERYFVYYEDSDLGLRARKEGIPSVVTGRVRWKHGWARETTALRWAPWKLEIPSMIKFYSRFPRLLSPWPSRTADRLESIGWPAP